MKFRGLAKRLWFGHIPLIRGKFFYYSHSVYFPLGSQTFERVCVEGVYEQETLKSNLVACRSGNELFRRWGKHRSDVRADSFGSTSR